MNQQEHFFSVQLSFALLSFFSGFLIAGQFPLAAKMYRGACNKKKTVAGLLYGSDLLGGYIGGIIGGIVLIPVLGLRQTCYIVAMVKLCSLIVLSISSRRLR
jgi:spermidine synthase